MNRKIENVLETLTKVWSEDLHEKIGRRFKEQRDHARLAEKAVAIANQNGYKNWARTWGETDWNGDVLKYPVTFDFDTARMTLPYDAEGIVFLPVYVKDKAYGHNLAMLLAVNLGTSEVTKIYTSEYAARDNRGSFKITPLRAQSDRYMNGNMHRKGYEPKVHAVYEVERTPSLREYSTLEPYIRLFTTGTTAEKKVRLAEVPVRSAPKECVQ